jgi:hypothetical protein
MLTPLSDAIPWFLALTSLAWVLAFTLVRRQLSNNLDKPARQKLVAATVLRYTGFLLLTAGIIFSVLSLQLASTVYDALLLVSPIVLAGAALINFRAIKARAEAGKSAVTLTTPDGSFKDWPLYLGLGIFMILTSSGRSSAIVAGLLFIGIAATTYLNNKRGTVIAERGICMNSKFVPWSIVESYQWPKSQDENSTLTINYRGRKDSIDNLTITAPEWNRIHIESFLNQKLSHHEVPTSAQVAQ